MFFSLITCTYNPQLSILSRLVNSVINLQSNDNIAFEWIIVDNNSTNKISDIPFISDALARNNHFKVILVRKPGLTNARLAGIKQAKYDCIIFFDDDNEPQNKYLINASQLIQNFPQVGCWGPGNIFVEFVDRKNKKHMESQKEYFQERHILGERYSNKTHWQEYYPQGTGLIAKREILISYLQLVESGKYNLKDREGKNLSSAGDVQIVLTAVKIGYSAGISESLSLNHLIQSSKVSLGYLSKLCYGTASSYIKAYNEIYSENGVPLIIPTNMHIIKQIYFWLRINKWNILKQKVYLKLVSRMGEFNAHCIAANSKNKPLLIKFLDLIFT